MRRFSRLDRAACLMGALLLAAASPVFAGEPPIIRWQKIDKTPGFPGLHDELQRIADRRGHGRRADFCVVLRDQGDKDPLAYAIWHQEHLLYRWEGTNDRSIGDMTLLRHRPLDLRKDIVHTNSDRLSTYKVTRAWVDDVEAQCLAHGEQVRLVRRMK